MFKQQGNGFGPCKNDIELNEQGIKSVQDSSVVLVQLYFTKLTVVRKFSIAEVSLTFKIQQTISHFIKNG